MNPPATPHLAHRSPLRRQSLVTLLCSRVHTAFHGCSPCQRDRLLLDRRMSLPGWNWAGPEVRADAGDGSGRRARTRGRSTASPGETLARIERVLGRWKANHGIDALGIASFGPIDVDQSSATYGHVLSTPKPGWAGTDVARRLQRVLGVPMVFDTDVNGAATAEMQWGSGAQSGRFCLHHGRDGRGRRIRRCGQAIQGLGHCDSATFACRDCRATIGPAHVLITKTASRAWRPDRRFARAIARTWTSSARTIRCGQRRLDARAIVPRDCLCRGAAAGNAIGSDVVEQQVRAPAGKDRSQADRESLNGFIDLPGDGPFIRRPGLGSDAGPLGQSRWRCRLSDSANQHPRPFEGQLLPRIHNQHSPACANSRPAHTSPSRGMTQR